MRITLVGPGIMPIPPVGWGAVEIVMHDYRVGLEKRGHTVTIVNTPYQQQIIDQINHSNPDFVHFHYDQHCGLFNYIQCPAVAVTSHFCYLEQPEKYFGFRSIFNTLINQRKVHLFTLAPGISQQFEKTGFPKEMVHLVPNGVQPELFRFNEICMLDRSIYLAKIDHRKRQYLFQGIENLDFAGGIADHKFNPHIPNYLGEWTKQWLYNNLTDYVNLVLLSDGEAHPLVCMEALSSGLGLVLSEYAVANLNPELPYIDIIPENRINDISYIKNVIQTNKENSIHARKEIRKYAIENFSIDLVIDKYYLPAIQKVLN